MLVSPADPIVVVIPLSVPMLEPPDAVSVSSTELGVLSPVPSFVPPPAAPSAGAVLLIIMVATAEVDEAVPAMGSVPSRPNIVVPDVSTTGPLPCGIAAGVGMTPALVSDAWAVADGRRSVR